MSGDPRGVVDDGTPTGAQMDSAFLPPPYSTLQALDGRTLVTFTDYVMEGEVVPVYRTFEDAEYERGHSVPMCVCRDGDDWWLESPRG